MSFIPGKVKQVVKEVTGVLKDLPTAQLEAVINDVKGFLESNKEDLNRLVAEYMTRKISREELVFLLKGKKNLVILKSLEQLAVSTVKLEETRDRVIKVLTRAALGGLLGVLRRLVKL